MAVLDVPTTPPSAAAASHHEPSSLAKPATNFARTTFKTDAQREAMTRQMNEFRATQNPFKSVDVDTFQEQCTVLEEGKEEDVQVDDLSRSEPVPAFGAPPSE